MVCFCDFKPSFGTFPPLHVMSRNEWTRISIEINYLHI
uniref:Uncharacterized protein n=1 Tax=Amphimedon queenslandica TaxID=400682 RepID=A0A1X7TFA5_AMPQE